MFFIRKACYFLIGFFYFIAKTTSAQDQRIADSLAKIYHADTLHGEAKLELLRNLSFNENNNYKKVPQIGNVVIHDHVEIGAGTTIDRATLGSTVIHKGVKLDNLIQIAHNVEIGENTVIAAQTGVAGSTKIGKNCMIGGQVGIIGHLSIADGVKIAAQSGIGTSITTPNEIVQGSPAFNISDYKRTYVVFKKLPQLERKINELEKKTGSLNPAENKS